jgi:hypothetical protein
MLDNTGRLDAGEPSYEGAKELRGIVVEAPGATGFAQSCPETKFIKSSLAPSAVLAH